MVLVVAVEMEAMADVMVLVAQAAKVAEIEVIKAEKVLAADAVITEVLVKFSLKIGSRLKSVVSATPSFLNV